MEDNNFNAWLAGFWEGEGCICKKTGGNYIITICQALDNNRTVELCMEEIQSKFKGHLYNRKMNEKHKPLMVWALGCARDNIFFLKSIYPYCQIRKYDIENALKHYETKYRNSSTIIKRKQYKLADVPDKIPVCKDTSNIWEYVNALIQK